MKKRQILIISIGITILFACEHKKDNFQFTLESPPDDWYRFVDPNYNVAIWLPNIWEPIVWDVPDSDISQPTYYRPINGSIDAELWVQIIPSDNFRDDYCIPLRDDCGDPPVNIYDIHVNDIAIPCARYDKGSFKWRHICVVGPYLVQQFRPESIGGNISFMLSLHTNDEWEAQVEPIWRNIVISFILEQPPGNE
jgi:hypothetical protein